MLCLQDFPTCAVTILCLQVELEVPEMLQDVFSQSEFSQDCDSVCYCYDDMNSDTRPANGLGMTERLVPAHCGEGLATSRP